MRGVLLLLLLGLLPIGKPPVRSVLLDWKNGGLGKVGDLCKALQRK